jgi:hypothetical protein
MSDTASLPVRLLKGFGRFWWDFLVGDTPEITAAVLVIVGAVALVVHVMNVNALAYVALPLLVVVTFAVTLYRARRSG